MADPLTLEIDTSQIDRFVPRFPVSGPRIVDATPENTGILRDSIFDDILGVKADIGGVNLEGIVSSSDYEPKVNAVEFGRKPGKMPPVEAIALWVRRKGLAGTYKITAGKTGRHARIGKREKQRKEDLIMAWAIAIKIGRVGTVGAA